MLLSRLNIEGTEQPRCYETIRPDGLPGDAEVWLFRDAVDGRVYAFTYKQAAEVDPRWESPAS